MGEISFLSIPYTPSFHIILIETIWLEDFGKRNERFKMLGEF
jgi:hypothetical protein